MKTSDLVLLAYVILIAPAMLLGFFFARRKMFEPYHKFTMTTITIVNWILILGVMLPTYLTLLPDVPGNLRQPGYLVPTLHLIPGAIAQILATYLVIRMWFEKQLPEWFKVQNIKLVMRTTLTLWLLTAVLGVLNWAVLTRGFLGNGAQTPVPVSTEQAVSKSGGTESASEQASGTEAVGTAAAAINPKIVAALQPLMVSADDAPNKTAYLAGLQAQTASVVKQAVAVGDALKQNDLNGAQKAAQSIVDAMNSGNSGSLTWYLSKSGDATKTLLDATSDAADIHAAASDMQNSENNAVKDSGDVLQQAQAIVKAAYAADAQQAAASLADSAGKLQQDVSQLVNTAISLNVPGSTLTAGS